MVVLKSYHVKHKRDFSKELKNATKVADYAVQHKTKYPSSKDVKDIELPSAIKNQILRKYGRGTIKEVHNVQLIVPNMATKNKCKDGSISISNSIVYNNGYVYLKPLKIGFNWNPGRQFKKIHCVEIDNHKFMIIVSFDNKDDNSKKFDNVLGIDLNCGVGRHIVNMADLKNNIAINLGKEGPNMRKKYFKKRKAHNINGNKEHRIMKDIDHKISNTIVKYALKNKLKIVLEELKGLRTKHKKGNGCKQINRLINSWSFYRLQQFIEYKSKENHIPVIYINPQYTSQECSYCSIIGRRKGKEFICKNKGCHKRNINRNSDINAAYNIGKRSLQNGGRATKK